MFSSIPPIKSLKEQCADRLEELILSGQLAVGQKLPPERILSKKMGISRPVVHEALVELSAKGLLKMIPRVGTLVSDYRKEGSLALLTSLFKYQRGDLAPKLLDGLLAMRMLFELENARLAALHRTEAHIRQMRDLIKDEEKTDPGDVQAITLLDFEFHHLVAMASDNLSYALLLNSCKPVYTSLTRRFFESAEVVPTVIGLHRDLADAVKKQDEQLAVAAMRCLLSHGEEHLRALPD